MENQNSILNGYLNDSRTLQNSLVGLSFLQSIGFLYKLDSLLPKLYKYGWKIAVVIIITFLINWFILFLAKGYDRSILNKMSEGDNFSDIEFTTSVSKLAYCFRISLIGLIDLITIILMFFAICIHDEIK
jgi:hypothetical protein